MITPTPRYHKVFMLLNGQPALDGPRDMLDTHRYLEDVSFTRAAMDDLRAMAELQGQLLRYDNSEIDTDPTPAAVAVSGPAIGLAASVESLLATPFTLSMQETEQSSVYRRDDDDHQQLSQIGSGRKREVTLTRMRLSVDQNPS